jgi:acetyltransferase
MTENFKHTEITPDQFYVQEYVEGKHELLIGGYRDPSFGPIIMFGAGGKYVEVFQDTIVKSAFSSYNDIADMINKTKIGKILAGVRGDKPTDIKVLVKLILNCCRMMIENSNIKEFDINPLLVTNENLFKAVDIRIKIENTI